VKRPTMLVEAVLRQAELDLDLSVERDVAVMRHRCEHEGKSFLTITLPVLSDALERGLECGRFTCPSNFSRHGNLPRFMGGFFKRVFNKDGGLRPNPCPFAIRSIRQVSRFFKKPRLECTPKREAKAEQHFLDVEGELRRMTSQLERKDTFLDKISGIIWAQIFPELDVLDLVCHHGPGVTADRLSSNTRYRIREWYQRSELTFPSDLHCYPNYGYAASVGYSGESISIVNGPNYTELRDESPVRVVFVPKTMTAPRVIAIEPHNVQYMQQSLKDYVYKILETHRLTKHSIRFARQDVNQRLAYSSSIDKRLATLDLKDASDRVALPLVQRIFKTSGILEYLEDSRSLHATLPSGRNIVLNKFASMGSAMCFPVEAMVFYTLIQSAMHQLDGKRPSSRSICAYSKQIDIYGDDIIVPVEYTDVVVNYLESYGLKVNVNKSFGNSHFRESCGADFFNGVDVKPVYAREYPYDDSRQWTPSAILSWNATADQFYISGQWHVAQVIRTMLSRVVRRPIPRSRVVTGGLAHFSLLFTTNLKYNRDLCGWRQKRLVYQPCLNKDDINEDELACLNKWGLLSSKRSSIYPRDLPLRAENGREGLSRMELADPGTLSGESTSGLLRLSSSDEAQEQASSLVLADLDGTDGATCEYLPGFDRPELSCLRELNTLFSMQAKDPLSFLDGRSEGLDFSASTKRGSFKSKSRWVSLAG
jgi:hypothetical protein